MKKIASLILVLVSVLVLASCETDPEVNEQRVWFNEQVASFTIEQANNSVDENFILPGSLEDITITWTSDNSSITINTVNSIVNAVVNQGPANVTVTLTATFTYLEYQTTKTFTVTVLQETIAVKTVAEKIQEDMAAVDVLFKSDFEIELLKKGPIHNSKITWASQSKYITSTGVVLPLVGEDLNVGQIEGIFTLEGESNSKIYDVNLEYAKEPELTTKRTVDFINMTTAYNVEDGSMELLFEDGSNVPYVRVSDFLESLTGFIDPNVDFEYSMEGNSAKIRYDYYDEDGQFYDLYAIFDPENDTITTPDPGFYYAYIYSTATNYARNIGYDEENPGAYYEYGGPLVYDLNAYNLQVSMYEDEVVLPLYIANLLMAGSSYYNVYYNVDKLIGFYGVPDDNSTPDVYQAIKKSSANFKKIPVDLLVHNFSYFAFVLDNFYGLQEIMEVDTYYDLLFENAEKLLSTAAHTLDDTISNILVQKLDELHTAYRFPGYYNAIQYEGPSYSIYTIGPRYLEWYLEGLEATDNAIAKKWGINNSNERAGTSDLRPDYWFLDDEKTSAVITLNDFYTEDLVEDTVWNQEVLETILSVDDLSLLPAYASSNKFYIYNDLTNPYPVAHVLIRDTQTTDVDNYLDDLLTAGFTKAEDDLLYHVALGEGYLFVKVLSSEDYQATVLSITVVDGLSLEEITFPDNFRHFIKWDTAVYFEFTLSRMKRESSSLVNVIIDLSFNTGGNVGALYRIMGFVTNQPFAVSRIDGDNGLGSTSYVVIDCDTFDPTLKWGLIITKTSFSAANSMATIFQDNNLGPIIGVKSGGGASSITPIVLPNGTMFTMSSNNINAYRENTGTEEDPVYVYTSNEFGIDPTHEVLLTSIFDEEVLLAIMNE